MRQAVVHAVRGAVLSPLNALGRVFVRDGRIEQLALDAIPFAPGARSLDQQGRERLAQVLRVLALHPDLALSLRGQVAEADIVRLKEDTVLAVLPAVLVAAERRESRGRARRRGGRAVAA